MDQWASNRKNTFITRRIQWWRERGFDDDTSIRQAKWEFARAVLRARQAGATDAEIGDFVGVGRQQIYAVRASSRRRPMSVIEEMFSDRTELDAAE